MSQVWIAGALFAAGWCSPLQWLGAQQPNEIHATRAESVAVGMGNAKTATVGVPELHMALTDALPFDTSVTVGTLPNGFKYYIRRNVHPEHRAELRLIVRAGSNNEDDDQRGLAHLVEHMAFDGSTHFAKRTLVDYLESIGLQFGADLNAETSFGSTMYQLRVPTDNPAQLETAFDVLADWAGGLTFDSAQVVAERGVVLEEWRRSLGAGSRVSNQQMPVLYSGSRYATRMPIGLPDIVAHATPSQLIRFYHDWYRPDLMAVVVVGDVDPQQIETWIRRRFAPLTNPANERARTPFAIPGNTTPLVSIVSDTEIPSASVSLTYKLPAFGGSTVGDVRESLARGLYIAALNHRLRELAQAPSPPFFRAQGSFGALGETDNAFTVSVTTPEGGVMDGFDATLIEVERLARFGLADAEFKRLRRTVMHGAEQAYADRGTIPSSSYVEAYIGHFLSGQPVTDAATNVGLVAQLLPTITNADIEQWASVWRASDNRVILVSLPKGPNVAIPDTSSLLAAFNDAKRERLTAYVDHASSGRLLDTLPRPGTIVRTRHLPYDITEWTLSNGIRVLLRPSTNSTRGIAIQGTSPGGFYLDLSHGYVPAATAAQVVGLGGYGKFSRTELEKLLTGHSVQAGADIGPYSQTLGGSASLDDLEPMLQLLYLAATQPRLDTEAIAAYKARARASLVNRDVSPEQLLQDTVALTLAQHHPLVRLPSNAWIDSMNAEQSLAVYRDRFRDMSDFRFVIVGDFTPDSIAPLIAQYLGALPGGGRRETPYDPGIRMPEGVVHKTVVGGREPRALNVLVFHGPFVVSRVNQSALTMLTHIMQLRLTDRLRRDSSGTYTVQVHANVERQPVSQYTITVSFVTAPERANALTASALALLDTLRRASTPEADIQKVRETELRGLETAVKSDAFWLARIAETDRTGLPWDDLTGEAQARQWSAAELQAAAQRYLDFHNYARFALMPVQETPQ